jgi:hypothetical protein
MAQNRLSKSGRDSVADEEKPAKRPAFSISRACSEDSTGVLIDRISREKLNYDDIVLRPAPLLKLQYHVNLYERGRFSRSETIQGHFRSHFQRGPHCRIESQTSRDLRPKLSKEYYGKYSPPYD